MAGKESEQDILVTVVKKNIIPATEIVIAGLTPVAKSLKETSGVIFSRKLHNSPTYRKITNFFA